MGCMYVICFFICLIKHKGTNISSFFVVPYVHTFINLEFYCVVLLSFLSFIPIFRIPFSEEIYACEKTFERIFLGALFGPNAPHFIAGWRSDFRDQVKLLKQKTLQKESNKSKQPYFIQHNKICIICWLCLALVFLTFILFFYYMRF